MAGGFCTRPCRHSENKVGTPVCGGKVGQSAWKWMEWKAFWKAFSISQGRLMEGYEKRVRLEVGGLCDGRRVRGAWDVDEEGGEVVKV